MKFPSRWLSALFSIAVLAGCSSMPSLEPVDHVDLDRFMGDWYVVANIPTALERGAHNAIESYRLNADGTIATTFTFRDGGFDGERKSYHPRGFVRSENNAVWGMQFVWPIKADYRIIWLDEDYATTVIGRNRRDYLWIMSRTPEIPETLYREILDFVVSVGYDPAAVQKVPQQW